MLWELTSLFLFIIIIVLIVINAWVSYARIDPSQCPTVNSDFGVSPNTVANILNQCGPEGDSSCTFTNITSLAAAVDICNQNANLCTLFVYSAVTATMSIADPTSTTTPSSGVDLYRRQYPIAT